VTTGKLTAAGMAWAGDSAGGLEKLCTDGKTNRAAVVAMLSATEARSEHPLAKAIAVYGKDLLATSALPMDEVKIEEFESTPGAGVKSRCLVGGKERYTVLVGNRRFALQDGKDLPASLEDFEARETELGRTLIFASILSGKLSISLLAISLSDAPKPSSAQAVKALKEMGIEVKMMTGDGRATALAVAKQVGIEPEGVWAGMSPKGKAAVITELIEKGNGGVAMVGDGINDSPALVAATVGIALSSGTSVAIEAAHIVLMRSDLLDVVAALHLSRSIFKVIRRNLLWACIYNVLGIPLAMGVFLPLGLYMHPMLAGAAMAFSSVSVVASSLMLRWWVRPANSVMPGERGAEATRKMTLTGWVVDGLLERVGKIWDWRRRRNMDGYSALPVEMT
jgi:Cu+-exporting ATPase